MALQHIYIETWCVWEKREFDFMKNSSKVKPTRLPHTKEKPPESEEREGV